MIRAIDPEKDGPGILGLIHEVVPFTTTTLESWRQQLASIPERARNGAWVAIVDGTVAGRAEASLNWFSESRTAFAAVSVREAFRRQGIGSRLWEVVEQHLHELAPSRVLSMFVETSGGVAFARARGFAEVRAETLASVDPRTVDLSPLESAQVLLVPLRDVAPEEVFEVDLVTTADVPMTDQLDDLRFEDWLETIWRKPTMTLDGSFAAVEDGRAVCITMLAANLERGRAFNEYTGTLPSHRGRGLASLVKLASALGSRERCHSRVDVERRDERAHAGSQSPSRLRAEAEARRVPPRR